MSFGTELRRLWAWVGRYVRRPATIAAIVTGDVIAGIEFAFGATGGMPLRIIALIFMICTLALLIVWTNLNHVVNGIQLVVFLASSIVFLLNVGDGKSSHRLTVTKRKSAAILVKPKAGFVNYQQRFVVAYRRVAASEDIWLIAKTTSGLYFPYLDCAHAGGTAVTRPSSRPAGRWQATLRVGAPGESGRGQEFKMLVVITKSVGTRALVRETNGWCSRTNGWPGFTYLPPATRITAAVNVVRR